MATILAEATRGPLIESVYRGDIAVVDVTGRILAHVGNPEKVTFWRSSAKPIQALPIIESGAADAFGFTDRDLALFAASHNAEPVHQEGVLEALNKAGLGVVCLKCGAHLPYDRETADLMVRTGEEPTVRHSNCSGKHTGMLALAKHLGFSLEDYLDPQSELQQVILRGVAAAVSMDVTQIAIGVDGCGVPVFGLPLRNMALAFARLAEPAQMPQGKVEAARRMREAMLNEPYMVAGRNRICTDLMRLPGRRFVAKSGAEGVYCVGVLPEAVASSPVLKSYGLTGSVGLAVKMEDGHSRSRDLTVVAALSQLGLLTDSDKAALHRHGPSTLKNVAGTEVGELRPAFHLQFE